MAVFKCKMCGGDLEIQENATVCECEYCGTNQTVPTARTEAIANLFNRANKLRLKCDFDKAEEIYEKILGIDEALAEAHWGLVLCKYGIEYVEDPKNHSRVPTCHRTSYEAVTADSDYLSAIEYADSAQKLIYRSEAYAIERIQKKTLEIAKNEKPFDVFICYKETDKNGKRTPDSAYANDIYHHLTNEGFKVFYAAITLEEKLGQEYEPYIFAALNSAKVMLVIGSKEEYFNAIWVKNEWSRFLKLMKKDRSKLLIPCYKDIDAYDLPEEFAHLQAQNIGKIGFVSDLIRGIKKVVVKEEEKTLSQTTIIQNTNASAEPLVKRAFLFLEDEEWERADEFCEKALNIDPENAMAYLGKMLVFFKLKKLQDITSIEKEYWHNKNYQKAERFADEGLKAQLLQYLQEYKENRYNVASEILNTAKNEEDYRLASAIFGGISDYKNSAELYERCIKNLNQIKTWRNEYKVIEKECSNKNKQLSEMKKRYHKMREDYLNLKGSKDSLGDNSTMKSYLILLGIYLISSTTAFLILNVETPTPLLSVLLVLTLMSSFCFGIAFLIQRWSFCKNSLRCISYDNIVSTCIILFVPFSKYYFAFKDMKKFREMKDYSGYLENQVALCMNSMNQLGGEISTVENEIKQMKERMNTLSTQGNF